MEACGYLVTKQQWKNVALFIKKRTWSPNSYQAERMMERGTLKWLQVQIMYNKKCVKIWMNVDFAYTGLGLREGPELNSSHNF